MPSTIELEYRCGFRLLTRFMDLGMTRSIYDLARSLGSLFLITAVLAAPWIFRSSMKSADQTVYALVLAASCAALITVLTAPRSACSASRLFPAAFLVLAGIGLGFLQTVPLSESVLSSLSPEIIRKSERLLPVPGTEEADFEAVLLSSDSLSVPEKIEGGGVESQKNGYWPSTISVCAQLTKDQVSDLVLAFMGFVSAGVLFQTRRQRFLVWKLAALNGFLLALMLIFLKMTGEFPGYRFFWPKPLCATYVNRNSFAGYLCICLAPALGLLLRGVLAGIRDREDEEIYYEGVRYERRSSSVRLLNGISDFFSLFSGKVLVWLAVSVFLIAGAALTFSRGGTLAVLFAFLTAALLFSTRRKSGLYLIPVWGGLAAAFFLLFWLGAGEPVQQRMETLLDTQEHESAVTANSRLDNWRSAFSTARDYQWRGTGLGTYALANRVNDRELNNDRYFSNAENQAVETMLVAGIPGLLLLFGEILLFGFFVMRALKMGKMSDRSTGESAEYGDDDTESRLEDRDAADTALIFGIGTAALLTGQIVSGSFDFGLFSYPNFLLMALLCGSFAGGVLTDPEEDRYMPLLDGRRRRTFIQTAALFLLTVAAVSLGISGFRSLCYRVETERLCAECLVPVAPEDRVPSYFSGIITQIQKALEHRPDDPNLHYQLGQVYTARFRQLFWEQLRADSPETDPAELWNRSAPEVIFASMQPFFRSRMTVVPRQFRSDPIVSENLIPALREFWITRRLMPMAPESHIESTVLAPLALEYQYPETLTQLSTARIEEISPNEPGVLYSIGLLQYLSGNHDEAVAEWKKSLALSDRLLPDITRILAGERTKAEFRRLLGEVISGDWRKAELGERLFPKKEEPVIHSVYMELMLLILNGNSDNESPVWVRNAARYKDLSGDPAGADPLYKKALEADPFNPGWHYEYGSFLLRNGRKGEAADEFARASELSPKTKAYKHVLEELEIEK